MSQLETIIYNSLSMPTELCHIIASYALITIRQVNYNNCDYYDCDGELYKCSNMHATGIINNCIYYIEIDSDNASKIIFNDGMIETSIYIQRTYSIKYSNVLICEHYDSIATYNIIITNGIITISELSSIGYFDTKKILLLYADNNYIITRLDYRDTHGIAIYDYRFDCCKKTYTNSHVDFVALVDDVLSYCTRNKWLSIDF